jgi:hypothetical protein
VNLWVGNIVPPNSVLKMETVCSSVTVLCTCKSTWCCYATDHSLKTNCVRLNAKYVAVFNSGCLLSKSKRKKSLIVTLSSVGTGVCIEVCDTRVGLESHWLTVLAEHLIGRKQETVLCPQIREKFFPR